MHEVKVTFFDNLLKNALHLHGFDPEDCTLIAARDFLTNGDEDYELPGSAGIVRVKDGAYFRVAFMPVLPLPVKCRSVHPRDIEKIIASGVDVMDAQYQWIGSALFLAACQPVDLADEDDAEVAIDHFDVEIGYTSSSLGIACWEHFGVVALLRMPNVRLLPAEAAVVRAVLQQCMPVYQETYCRLMELWVRQGYHVRTTARNITLNAPCGNRMVHLAYLKPGTPKSWPVIVLAQRSLKDLANVSDVAARRYQAAVAKITSQRETGSTIHIRVTPALDEKKVKALVKAMHQLAQSFQPDNQISAERIGACNWRMRPPIN